MVAPLPKPKPQPASQSFTGHSATGQTPPIPADAPSEALSDLPPETHTPDFNPRDPRQIETILDLFTDPDLSLRDIADQNNTTLQALTLWLARPEITEQLLDLECASVRRARFNISFALPKIANALSQSLEQATAEAEHLDRLANNFPCFTLRLRYRENIRKSVSHLLRISGFDPTAKHRAESERRRRNEQIASWRERCGLTMLDKHPPETPDSKSNTPSAPYRSITNSADDAPAAPAETLEAIRAQFKNRAARQAPSSIPHSALRIPNSELGESDTPNPKSDSPPAPHSAFRAPSSNYMLIAADGNGRTQIRGLTIPPELNQPGMPFTPVFDDSSSPSNLSLRSNPSAPSIPSDPAAKNNPGINPDNRIDADADTEIDADIDDDSPDLFDFCNMSILSTRVLAALGLLGPDLTDVEVANGMVLVQNAIDALGEELVGLPLEQIVEKVGERLIESPTESPIESPSREAALAPLHTSSA